MSGDRIERVAYRCPRCQDITYAFPGPSAVACKWGRCNGTVREAALAPAVLVEGQAVPPGTYTAEAVRVVRAPSGRIILTIRVKP